MLGTHELGEADLLVTLLAEHSGRVRGVAASARKSRRRFGGALEPMTRVRASWVERDGRELHRIESLETARSFATMQAEPAVQAACAVVCEIAGTVGREGEADPKGFRLVGAVLEALEDGLDPWVAVRYFEYWILRLHGVLPDPSSCASCGRPLGADQTAVVAAGDGLRCALCAREARAPGRALTRADRAFLAAAALLPPSRMGEHLEACLPAGALDEMLRGALEAFAERRFRTYRHLAAASRPDGGPKP